MLGLFWGLVAAGALLAGGVGALVIRSPAALTAAAVVLTAGAVICAFGFDLDEKAYELGGGAAATLGTLGGGVFMYVACRMLGRPLAGPRLGSIVLAAVPASIIVALTVLEDADVGGAILATVFFWNIALAAWI